MARKILLADDSVTAQNMGRKILTEAGYEVITVNNGSSALKKATEAKPDLIILDVYMPGYGGLEVCQRIKDTPESARIPILLSVGKLEPFRADEARKAGADAHIVKPFEASELLAAINKLEDRIVPQGIARRLGRSTRIAIEDGTELRDGWKDRLPTPISKGKRPTTDWEDAEEPKAPETKPAEPVATQTDSPKSDQPREDFAIVAATPEAVQSGEKQPETKQSEDVAAQAQAAIETAAADTPETKTPVGVEAAPAAPEGPVVPAAVTTRISEVGGETERAGNLAESEVAAALASLGENDHAIAPRIGSTMQDEAATIVGPRWIAEEVALTDDEANCVLEREMEKALAAIAATEAAPAEADSVETTTASQEMAASSPASYTQSTAEPSRVDASDPLICELKAPEPVPENAAAGTVTHAIEPAEISAEAVSAAPVAATQELAAYAAAASSSPASSSTSSSSSSPAAAKTETETEPQLHDAWVNWKQIRQAVIGSQLAVNLVETADSQVTGSEFKDIRREPPVSSPEAQPPQEASTADADEAAAIASVVDSVLADLKPKLMEEIARKMGKGPKKS